MIVSSSRATRQWAVVVVLALACLLAPVTADPVAADAAAAVRGKVRGEIIQSKGSPAPKIKMQWFDRNWKFLGARKVAGGVYSLSLPEGKYYLQFVDQRPSYDVTKAAPADVTVKIQAGRTVTRTVRMRRGAAIGGTVKAGGKVSPGATVIAANTNQQSYTSKANDKGQYALGGLPAGNYSIFTYERKKQWVGKSIYLPKVKAGQFRNVNPALTKRGGKLSVDLYAGDKPFKGSGSVTAVSRATGQFWTARISRGTVLFQGLYQGGYYLEVPGSGNYLSARVGLRNKVRPGRVTFSSAALKKRGGWVTGFVVDEYDPSFSLKGARVRLYDESGALRDTATSRGDGSFLLDGQLLTGSYTVVADPGEASGGYLGEEPHRCLYGSERISNVKITTGRGTDVGEVPLEPAPGQEKCNS
ncbi:MAG: carboxypeptidase-like regulatory domain-containing protein [Nocardioides sp.]